MQDTWFVGYPLVLNIMDTATMGVLLSWCRMTLRPLSKLYFVNSMLVWAFTPLARRTNASKAQHFRNSMCTVFNGKSRVVLIPNETTG